MTATLLTAHFSLLYSHCSLLTSLFSLLTSLFSLLTAHFSLLTSHYLMLTSLLTAHLWLATVVLFSFLWMVLTMSEESGSWPEVTTIYQYVSKSINSKLPTSHYPIMISQIKWTIKFYRWQWRSKHILYTPLRHSVSLKTDSFHFYQTNLDRLVPTMISHLNDFALHNPELRVWPDF